MCKKVLNVIKEVLKNKIDLTKNSEIVVIDNKFSADGNTHIIITFKENKKDDI